MKYLQTLSLLVMAAASLMVFVSSASAASVLTSPAGTHFTGSLLLTLTPGSSTQLKAGIEDTCTESTIATNISVNNTSHAEGAISTLTDSKCTIHTVTLKNGSLTVADNGTATIFNSEVTSSDTALGISCVYGGGSTGTALGTLTGGSPAELTVSTTHLKKISGSFFCSSEGTTTGRFVVTKPTSLFVT